MPKPARYFVIVLISFIVSCGIPVDDPNAVTKGKMLSELEGARLWYRQMKVNLNLYETALQKDFLILISANLEMYKNSELSVKNIDTVLDRYQLILNFYFQASKHFGFNFPDLAFNSVATGENYKFRKLLYFLHKAGLRFLLLFCLLQEAGSREGAVEGHLFLAIQVPVSQGRGAIKYRLCQNVHTHKYRETLPQHLQ